MQGRTFKLVGFALASVMLIATACSSNSSSSSTGGSSGASQTTADATGKTDLPVSADDFFFNPNTIDGSASQSLTFTIKNDGTATHNFTLGSTDMGDILPGQTKTFQVSFPASGTVTFFCKFHQSQGMTGQLVVT